MTVSLATFPSWTAASGARVYEVSAEHFGGTVGNYLVSRMQDHLDEGRLPVVALPTGSTPLGVYEWWRNHPHRIDWAQVRFTHLDEYVGAGPSDPKSYALFLSQQVFAPLMGDRPGWENVHRFNGLGRPEDEIERQQRFISGCGGLDIAFLGIGEGPAWSHYRWYRWLGNGSGLEPGRVAVSFLASLEASVHVGFNERGTPFDEPTHVTELHRRTRRVNNVAFTHAITMGLATILGSREIVLAAKGGRKRSAVDLTFNQAATRNIPASALQRAGKRVTVFVDPDANPFRV